VWIWGGYGCRTGECPLKLMKILSMYAYFISFHQYWVTFRISIVQQVSDPLSKVLKIGKKNSSNKRLQIPKKSFPTPSKIQFLSKNLKLSHSKFLIKDTTNIYIFPSIFIPEIPFNLIISIRTTNMTLKRIIIIIITVGIEKS
jgi:hypothetical protein